MTPSPSLTGCMDDDVGTGATRLGSAVSSHTPGPWIARQEFANRWRIESHAKGPDFIPVSVGLACTTILEVGCNDKDTAANARLMASAPKMYSALAGMITPYSELSNDDLRKALEPIPGTTMNRISAQAALMVLAARAAIADFAALSQVSDSERSSYVPTDGDNQP